MLSPAALADGDLLGAALDLLPTGALGRDLRAGARIIGSGSKVAASSVWNSNKFVRGRSIQRALDGFWGTDLDTLARSNNVAGIDQFNFTTGLATQIKSIDTRAKTYAKPGALKARIRAAAAGLAHYEGGSIGAGRRLDPSDITGRQLVVAMPTGSLTRVQARALAQVRREIQRSFDGRVKVTYLWIG